MTEPVLYVLKRYPRLSETFIVRELATLEALGEHLLVDALLPPEDEPRHPEVGIVDAEVRYLPRRPKLRNPEVLAAHARIARRMPRAWLAEAQRARRDGIWRRFVQAGLTADRARRTGVVHIHAHFATAAAEVAGIAGRLAGVPVTVTAHAKDIYHESNAPHLQRRLEGVAGIVTISRRNADHLATAVPHVAVHHIPNGVAVSQASREPIPNGVVLCVARLVEKKGVDTLVRAVARVARNVPTVRAEVVGAGPLRHELELLAADLGVQERITFSGALPFPEVERAYRRAAMLVLPCRVADDGDRDGLPTVLLEAMGRGLPVVSTHVAAIPELVLHEENGLLVPPDDDAALARAIVRLYADPAWAAALGRAGRSSVARGHDPVRSARALQRLYHG